jgi:hypothetical protein
MFKQHKQMYLLIKKLGDDVKEVKEMVLKLQKEKERDELSLKVLDVSILFNSIYHELN